MGLNLYVVQSLRERGAIIDVIRGALLGMVVLIGLLMALPDVALWLPNWVMGRG